MHWHHRICRLAFTAILGSTPFLTLVAQEPVNSELHRKLVAMDSILFDEGFNKCNSQALYQIIHADLEFLHDQGGRMDLAGFKTAHKNNICGGGPEKPIRILQKETLKVYPLHNNGVLYAAIQSGRHDFYLEKAGQKRRHTSTALFTHTWLLENGTWKLWRVLSYDHQNPAE